MGTMSNLHAELSLAAPALCQMLDDGTLPENAVTDLAHLMARLEQAEIDFDLNNGESIRLGFGTLIVKNGGAVATALQWLDAYRLRKIKDMLVNGIMEMVPSPVLTADALNPNLGLGVEIRYTCTMRKGGSRTDLDLDELMQYLDPIGTIDGERIWDLVPGGGYTTCNGQARVSCYGYPSPLVA